MSVQQKNKLADSVIMSKILYGIAVWGKMVSRTQLERIQTVQTLTMRWIVGDQYRKENRHYWNSKELLEEAGWMLVRQLLAYYSLMLLLKVNRDSSPARLVRWIQKKMIVVPRIDITERCWLRSAVGWWDKLDAVVLKTDRISPVKTYIKSWVISKI